MRSRKAAECAWVGGRETRRSCRPDRLVVLLFFVALLGSASADQADHHAFIGGTSDVPPREHELIQINHTLFQWATIWYSARVLSGPPILAFLVDGENRTRYESGQAYEALPGTTSGPTTDASGLAGALPRALYFLLLANGGTSNATVKWEVFLEPRLTGEAGNGAPLAPDSHGYLPPLVVAAAVAVAIGLLGWLRHSRRL